MMSETAQAILQATNAVGQEIRIKGPITTPPRFMRDLCSDLAGKRGTQGIIATPEGRLVVSSQQLQAPFGKDSAILVTMQMERPRNLRLVERLLDIAVSPKQRGIMLQAALGCDRAEVAARTGTGTEAMKKHLGAIYQATGTRSWDAMVRLF